MFRFEKKILDNGLRVILIPMKNSEAVTILVLVGVGSRYETKRISGVSHFLEHLFFKGTKRRPNPGDISRELDRIGASHNAFTTKETTGFWVKSSAKDFDISLDVVSDILLEPIFKKEEIDKERNVIIEEINMIEDMPQNKIFNELFEVTYGDQPLGWTITGAKESVKNIERDNILKYREGNYVGQNMLVAIAGGIDKDKTLKKVKNYFKKTKKGKYKPPEKIKISQDSPQVKFINKDLDQTHLAIGLRAYDVFDERRYALSVLSVILGEKTSSRLFMEIREKLGLAYYVGSVYLMQLDTGLLTIRAGVSLGSLEKAVNKTLKILSDLQKKGVSKKELDDAKSHIRGRMALGFETTDDVADFYGEQELFYQKILQPKEILKKIEKINQNDILKVANDIFKPSKINMAVIGRQENARQAQNYYQKLFSKI